MIVSDGSTCIQQGIVQIAVAAGDHVSIEIALGTKVKA